MAQFYPSLFSFHLLGERPGWLAKKQDSMPGSNNRQAVSLLPANLQQQIAESKDNPLFFRQKQLLNLIHQLGLAGPQQQTLNKILAYAAIRQKERDNDNYDAQGTLSVCN